MKNKLQHRERRKHRRYPIAGHGVALVSSPSQVFKLGDILDISVAGVALRYVGNGHYYDETYELTILFRKQGICLKALPGETVSNEVLKKANGCCLPTRRWSLKFGKMTPEQLLIVVNLIAEQEALKKTA